MLDLLNFICLGDISASCCTFLCIYVYLQQTQNVLVLLNCQHFDSNFTGRHEFDYFAYFLHSASHVTLAPFNRYATIISDSTTSVKVFSSFSAEFLMPDSSRIKATALHVRLISCMQISIGLSLPFSA